MTSPGNIDIKLEKIKAPNVKYVIDKTQNSLFFLTMFDS